MWKGTRRLPARCPLEEGVAGPQPGTPAPASSSLQAQLLGHALTEVTLQEVMAARHVVPEEGDPLAPSSAWCFITSCPRPLESQRPL